MGLLRRFAAREPALIGGLPHGGSIGFLGDSATNELRSAKTNVSVRSVAYSGLWPAAAPNMLERADHDWLNLSRVAWERI